MTPFAICTPAHLNAVSTQRTAHFIVTRNFNLAGQTITPIGTFSGTFDGDDHTLSNLTLTGTTDVALFGEVSGATIKRLRLRNVAVSGDSRVTGLALSSSTAANTTVIEDVHVSGAVSATNGSVAGLFLEALGTDRLERISFRGTVTNGAGGEQTAGIVRQLGDNAVVRDVLFSGTITSQRSNVGGIVTFLNGTVERAVVRATMSAAPSNRFGGIAGAAATATARIDDVFVDVTINGSERLGGIVGQVEGAARLALTRAVSLATIVATIRDAEAIAGVGPGNVTATNVFFSTDRTRTVVATAGAQASAVLGASGLTNAQLQDAANATLNGLAAPTWTRTAGSFPALAFEATLPTP